MKSKPDVYDKQGEIEESFVLMPTVRCWACQEEFGSPDLFRDVCSTRCHILWMSEIWVTSQLEEVFYQKQTEDDFNSERGYESCDGRD